MDSEGQPVAKGMEIGGGGSSSGGKHDSSHHMQWGRANKACSSTFVVDDEMDQTIASLHSVNIKTKHFVAAEIGSRQGQWVLKAVKLAKAAGDYASVYGYSVELLDVWKRRQITKLQINNIQDMVNISANLITSGNYGQLIHDLTMRTGSWQPINYMDWDCQGCEKLLASDSALKLFEDNILSLFIAVHTDDLSTQLTKFYSSSAMVNTGGPVRDAKCETANKDGLINNRGFVNPTGQNCMKDSPFGPVFYRDGTLRLFNQKLYDKLGLSLRLPKCVPWELG